MELEKHIRKIEETLKSLEAEGKKICITSSFQTHSLPLLHICKEVIPNIPVLFIDTAGIDDVGALGEQRIEKTLQAIKRTDLALIIAESGNWGTFEQELLEKFKALDIAVIIVFNKADLTAPSDSDIERLKGQCNGICVVSATENQGITALRKAIIDNAPEDFFSSNAIVNDIVGAGGVAILVVPIDKEAPKGRLILPQVQTIRDVLDGDATAIVCKERELRDTFGKLNVKPDIVITDSQAFLKVAADTPNDIAMTSFSILFARLKANLADMVRGAMAIENLKAGDKVLICESCTHHPITDDIGTVKIPRWLNQFVGSKLQIDHSRGADWSDNLSQYKLIIHCGGCMWNKRQMISRMLEAKAAGVPMTNYGLTIAYTLGIFERALQPFPAAIEMYRSCKDKQLIQ